MKYALRYDTVIKLSYLFSKTMKSLLQTTSSAFNFLVRSYFLSSTATLRLFAMGKDDGRISFRETLSYD